VGDNRLGLSNEGESFPGDNCSLTCSARDGTGSKGGSNTGGVSLIGGDNSGAEIAKFREADGIVTVNGGGEVTLADCRLGVAEFFRGGGDDTVGNGYPS
jgi:hypothetical protein